MSKIIEAHLVSTISTAADPDPFEGPPNKFTTNIQSYSIPMVRPLQTFVKPMVLSISKNVPCIYKKDPFLRQFCAHAVFV